MESVEPLPATAKHMSVLPYNPGILPSKPAPQQGETVEIVLEGYPPWKDEHCSIRNNQHVIHERFVRLRQAATEAMGGRAWVMGPVCMDFTLYAPGFEPGKNLLDYAAGIEDTVDGSSGYTFTYLPIVLEDDCQICEGRNCLVLSSEVKYRVVFTVL
jgi:hypothetical protein